VRKRSGRDSKNHGTEGVKSFHAGDIAHDEEQENKPGEEWKTTVTLHEHIRGAQLRKKKNVPERH